MARERDAPGHVELIGRWRAIAIAILLVGCRRHHEHTLASASASAITDPRATVTKVTIEVDSARLAAFGITLQDVEAALVTNHIHIASRTASSFVIATSPSPSDCLALAIKVLDGSVVRISDVARVTTSL